MDCVGHPAILSQTSPKSEGRREIYPAPNPLLDPTCGALNPRMASTKQKIAVGLASGGLILGAMSALQPPSPDSQQRALEHTQQQVNDLSDAQQNEHDRYRDAGNDHGDAENARRLTTSEHRPPEPRLRIRLP